MASAAASRRATSLAANPTHATSAAPRPWPTRLAQWLILLFAATVPLYFDLNVPEVSGDIRWQATTVFAGL
ncbi:MAG: hypothetical protein INF43_05650, partial [Alphaproteobacteria bacterium]|nr:hypothetical protein [Alphaproteobacteria bacterium]